MYVWLIGVLGIGLFAGGFWLKMFLGRRQLASAELKSKQVLEEAARQAEAARQHAQIDAKELLHSMRQEFEEKTKERRTELNQMEKRLHQREELIDRKLELLDHKEKDATERVKQLASRDQSLKAKEEDMARLLAEEKEKLKVVAGLGTEEAKQLLLSRVEQDCRA